MKTIRWITGDTRGSTPPWILVALLLIVVSVTIAVGVFVKTSSNAEVVKLGKCVFQSLDYGRRYNQIGRPPEQPVKGKDGQALDPRGGLKSEQSLESVDLSPCQKYLDPLTGR